MTIAGNLLIGCGGDDIIDGAGGVDVASYRSQAVMADGSNGVTVSLAIVG